MKELQFYFFPKTPCLSSKCILQTPRLFVLPTPVSMQRSFHQNLQRGALTHLAQSLGIAKSETCLSIGTGESDLSMFEASEMKFAMGNAVEILKKEADHMLPDCDHNGVTEGAALLEMMTT